MLLLSWNSKKYKIHLDKLKLSFGLKKKKSKYIMAAPSVLSEQHATLAEIKLKVIFVYRQNGSVCTMHLVQASAEPPRETWEGKYNLM